MQLPERTTQKLRKFSLGIVLICTGLGALLFFKEHPVAAGVFASLTLWGILGLLIPTIITPLYLFMSVLGLILGWFNTRIILGLVFFLVFTPLGLFFRLIRRDPLNRRPDSKRETYWEKVDSSAFETERYEQQY